MKGPVAKLKRDPYWLTNAEKKDINILQGVQPMKCSEVLNLADNKEGLFVYLCNVICLC